MTIWNAGKKTEEMVLIGYQPAGNRPQSAPPVFRQKHPPLPPARRRKNLSFHQKDGLPILSPMEENEFEIAVSMGWQRLIPKYVLDKFAYGVYGFHGNCGYLPFGRGRSPLNWSIIQGDTRFNLNLFRYCDDQLYRTNVFVDKFHNIFRRILYPKYHYFVFHKFSLYQSIAKLIPCANF